MKRMVLSAMMLIALLTSLAGCLVVHDGYGRGERHDRDGGHERGGDHDRDDGRGGGGRH